MNKSLLNLLLFFTFLLCFGQSETMAQTIRYVKQNATGSGTSWDNASGNLQVMIDASQSGDQVWVAAGEYQPASSQSFFMKEGVKIYGGFTGGEISVNGRNRNLAANRTTLRGNGARVITNDGNNLSTSAVLDGFTITGGSGQDGAGMYNNSSSPYISNCVFLNNSSNLEDGLHGGGMNNSNASPEIVNCVFKGNESLYGGALYFTNSHSRLINCVITGNNALFGAAFCMEFYDLSSFINCTITDNSKPWAGDIYLSSLVHATITNSILFNSEISIDDTDFSSIIYNNSMTDADPVFTNSSDPDGADNVFGTTDDGLKLSTGSAAINNGNKDLLPDGFFTDITGASRVKDDELDMGAYESGEEVATCDPAVGNILYVDAGKVSSGNGSNWDQAFKSLNEAMNAALLCSGVREIYVAKGTYQPVVNESFVMKEGVKIYGGFLGNETDKSQRNWAANPTLLKGNGSHVIKNDDTKLTNASVLDGFTITDGNSALPGGGMYNKNAFPTVFNCVFKSNVSSNNGGAIYNEGDGTMYVYNSLFHHNSSLAGGAIANKQSGKSVFTNCTFTENQATNAAGAIHNETNGKVTLRNSIVWNNTNGSGTQLLSVNGGSIHADHSLVEGGESNITGTHTVVSLLTTDPLFTDLSNANYSIGLNSPAVNQGSNDFFPDAANAKDLAGNARIYESTIDLGSFETKEIPPVISIRYVKPGGTGNGHSWENASGDLQEMISESASGNSVWVVEGEYQPAAGASFILKKDVKVYGGFAGTETVLPARTISQTGIHKTILRGNGNSVVRNDNNGLTLATILDGFVITGGTASFGGGIFIKFGSATISNCIISGNTGTIGAGMYIEGGSTNVFSCVIKENNANGAGGSGGGIATRDSSPTIANCIFDDNHSGFSGGALTTTSGSPVITNCVFQRNSAAAGRGNEIQYNFSNVVVSNTILWNTIGSPFIRVIEGTLTVRHSIVKGGYDGLNNLDSDPQFVNASDPDGEDNIFGTADDGLKPGDNSQAINTGNNDYFSDLATAEDLAGNARLFGSKIDLGPYESQVSRAAFTKYVKPGATSNGYSWENASGDLQDMINQSGDGGEVWVAAGEYQPVTGQSFAMKENVKIYGGFPATGAPLITDRNWRTNETILKGNDNRVITNENNGLTNAAVLDGFTIRDGASNEGAGIRNVGVSPLFFNLIITENHASGYGGGIYNQGGSPEFTNIIVNNNVALALGGGLSNQQSTVRLTNSLVVNNMSLDAGIFNLQTSFTLTNVTVSNNSGTKSNYISIVNMGVVIARNSIIVGKEQSADQVISKGSNIEADYSLIQGRDADPDRHNLDGSLKPGFIDANAGNFGIKADSPLKNMGNNSFFDNLETSEDLAGNPRLTGANVDLGAYESLSITSSDTRFVKEGGTGNGYSWETASGDLQAMVDDSDFGNEVWVAAGTYQRPSTQYFSMKEGVRMYGGFIGTETLLSQRNWGTNQTILRGNNKSVFINYESNLTNASVLDGFIITGGEKIDGGGGMKNLNVSPTISNVVFTGNKADAYGGALYNADSSPKLTNVVFYNNESGDFGGAVYNAFSSFPSISQATFLNNKAPSGNAIFTSSGATATVNNSVFYNTGDLTVIENGSGGEHILSNNLVQTSVAGTDLYVISADPFTDSANPAGADGKWMTADDGLQLNACSPAVNTGKNENIPNGTSFDITGNPRQYANGLVDMGAFEYQSTLTNTGVDLLALNDNSATSNILSNNKNLIVSSADPCRTILSILPNGTSPVSGIVTVTAWIDSKVNDANGAPYAQRHYDISPTSLTATASLTLYYSQAEFDAFNLKVGASQKIPAGSDDASGKSNLRIFQYHGASSDGSGSPASYNGSITAIDPTDTDIVWNSGLARWEVSFSVTGFSGFFLGTASLPLPVKLVSFTGKLSTENLVKLEWRVTEQVDIEKYVVESSVDGLQFSDAGVANANQLTATIYTFSDNPNQSQLSPKQVIYYRLRIIETDGKVEFSRIIAVQLQNAGAITLYPLPTKATVWLKWEGQDLKNKKAQIVNVKGQVLQDIFIDKSPLAIDVSKLESGIYFIKTESSPAIKIVKE